MSSYRINKIQTLAANNVLRTIWCVTNLDGYVLGEFQLLRDAEAFASNEEAADEREWLGSNPQWADAY